MPSFSLSVHQTKNLLSPACSSAFYLYVKFQLTKLKIQKLRRIHIDIDNTDVNNS